MPFRKTTTSTTPTYPPGTPTYPTPGGVDAGGASPYGYFYPSPGGGGSGVPSPYMSTEMLGMLPMPESPVMQSGSTSGQAGSSSSSMPRPWHRQTASLSSGPHPPSPLGQPALVHNEGKGKGRARD